MPNTTESTTPRSIPLRGPHSRFAPAPKGPLTILLVDDQARDVERWLEMLDECLEGAARTQVVQSAADALAALARDPADVVLTEYRLPDADGLGLVASITARHPGVATILVTSEGNETIAANALRFGARDYLVKSEIDAAALHRSIVQASSKAKQDRDQAWRLEQLEQSRNEMDHFVRSLSHDMTAMFMLLDHSFQRLKNAAEPVAANPKPSVAAARAIEAEPHSAALGPLTQQFAHVEACLRESKRFLDDLTTVARTGTVQMEPSRVELPMLVEEVLFEQRELLAERNVKVEIAGDLPAVWCNPCRVKQVLTNLVRNAVRHGCDPSAPRITIARHPATDPSDTAFEWLSIHDNGRGIAPESREEIFEAGRRLADAHPDGSGMGLSIVRKIVQHYGGQVFVAPADGPGTTFVLSLPSVAADSRR